MKHKNLYSLRFDIGEAYPEQEDRMQLSRELVHELQRIDGVESISRGNNPPIRDGFSATRLYDETESALGQFSFTTIDTQYFNTIGIKVIAGRTFTDQEVRNDEDPIVLSQAAAKGLGNNEEVIGNVFYSGGGRAYKVVGIVRRY